MMNFDDFDIAVKSLTGGTNTVVLDDMGMPSVMVALPKQNSHDLCGELISRTHPAWICKGAELDTVYISKFQNVIYNGRAYSLPLQDPQANISFDGALDACRRKGELWGLTPAALWGAIAMWCKKNGTLPHGNNNYGVDYNYPLEKGTPKTWSNGSPSKIYHTATGSGPETWNHNRKEDGIADLNGNLSEWQGGIRLMSGEINVIRDADCMINDISQTEDSLAWLAVDEDNQLVPVGSGDGIKLDFVDLAWRLINGDRFESQKNTTRYCFFQDMTSGLKQVPQLLKEIAMFPADSDMSGYAKEYMSAYNGPSERMLYRGGSYAGNFFAGMFCSGMNLLRNYESAHFGFRAAYYGKP